MPLHFSSSDFPPWWSSLEVRGLTWTWVTNCNSPGFLQNEVELEADQVFSNLPNDGFWSTGSKLTLPLILFHLWLSTSLIQKTIWSFLSNNQRKILLIYLLLYGWYRKVVTSMGFGAACLNLLLWVSISPCINVDDSDIYTRLCITWVITFKSAWIVSTKSRHASCYHYFETFECILGTVINL